MFVHIHPQAYIHKCIYIQQCICLSKEMILGYPLSISCSSSRRIFLKWELDQATFLLKILLWLLYFSRDKESTVPSPQNLRVPSQVSSTHIPPSYSLCWPHDLGFFNVRFSTLRDSWKHVLPSHFSSLLSWEFLLYSLSEMGHLLVSFLLSSLSILSFWDEGC